MPLSNPKSCHPNINQKAQGFSFRRPIPEAMVITRLERKKNEAASPRSTWPNRGLAGGWRNRKRVESAEETITIHATMAIGTGHFDFFVMAGALMAFALIASALIASALSSWPAGIRKREAIDLRVKRMSHQTAMPAGER